MFNFLETEFEIWACFGPVGNTKNCPTGQLFMLFRAKILQHAHQKDAIIKCKKTLFFLQNLIISRNTRDTSARDLYVYNGFGTNIISEILQSHFAFPMLAQLSLTMQCCKPVPSDSKWNFHVYRGVTIGKTIKTGMTDKTKVLPKISSRP